MEAATQKATWNGKDIFLCFTASEWCTACQSFDEHYLTQTPFVQRLAEEFELVRIETANAVDDSQNTDSHSPDFELRRKYDVASYPTVVLTNAQGVPWAVTGMRPGGIADYLGHLNTLKQQRALRQQSLADARNTTGLERARLLGESLPDLGDGGLRSARFYGDILREIVELDPDNATGFSDHARFQLADLRYVQDMRTLDQQLKWTEMVDLTDEFIRSHQLVGQQKQAALMNRFDIHRRQGDLDRMLGTLKEVVRENPYSRHGRQAREVLQSLETRIQVQQILSEEPFGT